MRNAVQLAPLSRERVQGPDNAAAGLRGLGEGLASFGRATGQFAQAEDDLDAARDNASAKLADVGFVAKAQAIRAGFKSTQGLNAQEQRAGAEKALQELYHQTAASMKTNRARAMLDETMLPRLASWRGEMDEHEVGQTFRAEDDASIARINTSGEEAQLTTDPTARKLNIETGLGEIAARGKKLGWGADAIQGAQFKFESGVLKDIGMGMLSAADPDIDAVSDFITANEGKLSGNDVGVLQRAIQEPLQRRVTNDYVSGIMGVATEKGGQEFTYASPVREGAGVPVPGGQYGAKRDYGAHKGVDIPAKMGSAVQATGPGIARVTQSKLGGITVTVDHGGGNVTRYMHLAKANIQNGQAVTPDTVVGTVGMTGRSSGPHLHYEVLQGGKSVDPAKVTTAIQQSPRRHDLSKLLGSVDADVAAGRITPEQGERYKVEVERRVGRDEKLQSRVEDDAQRAALKTIADAGEENFTSTTQIPRATWALLSPQDQVSFQQRAAANAKGIKAQSDGDTAFNLSRLAMERPDEFAKVNLDMVAGQLTQSEYLSFRKDQIEMGQKPDKVPSDSKAWRFVTQSAPELGFNLSVRKGKPASADDRAKALRLKRLIIAEVDLATGGKRAATDEDYQNGFDRSVRLLVLNGDKENAIPAYELGGPAGEVPAKARAAATQALRARGQPVTEANVARMYAQAKSR